LPGLQPQSLVEASFDFVVYPIVSFRLTPGFRSAKFCPVAKTWSRAGVAIGFLLLFAGALDVRGHFGFWATFSIMLGLFLIVFGASFFAGDKRRKGTRRVSFGFLGAALVFLCIALATTF
jgi:hypothetical protein